jgi:8-oxo-dGTP pyrophosphatase MutT (NUDIX family)
MTRRIRTSVVVIHNDKILTFRAIDPSDGREYFFLPGGKIESHETATDGAERETFEETGFRVRVDAQSCIDKEYYFRWNGEDFDCLTLFYRAHLQSPLQTAVKDADYNKGVHWKDLKDLDQVFSYSKDILEVVKALVA